MKPSEENGGSVPDNRSNSSSSNSSNFEFHRGSGPSKASQPRKVAGPRGKPTPSKWDDAQKWLVGFSGGGGGEEGHSKTKPRSSNAEDRRLLHSASQKGRFSCSSIEGLGEEGETKNIDFWKINQATGESPIAMRAVCVRDMGTEMTPVASQGPSRAATPIGATTPALRSPISSRSSTPERSCPTEGYQASAMNLDRKNEFLTLGKGERDDLTNPAAQPRIPDSLESRAMAWDEAERAKDMARWVQLQPNPLRSPCSTPNQQAQISKIPWSPSHHSEISLQFSPWGGLRHG